MDSIIVNFAYIGSIMLAVCALPEAYSSWKKGRNDNSWSFLLLWFFGEVFTLIYVLYNKDIPLILNYGLNLIFISVILKYKWKPRSKDV